METQLTRIQPTIITSLGYSAANAQLLTVPPYALAFIMTLSVATLSERMKTRAPFMMACSAFAMIGYIILLSNDHTHKIMAKSVTDPSKKVPMGVVNRPGVSYVGVFFAAGGIYPATALALSWPAVNVSGQTKRAVACGMQITLGNLAAVLGTQLYRTETAPLYRLGHGFALGYLFANICVGALTWFVLTRENKRRDALHAPETTTTHQGWEGDEDPRWRFTT